MHQSREVDNSSSDSNSGLTASSTDLQETVRRLTRELEQKQQEIMRQSQIEAALERVRSHSLSMHKSDELQEVIRTVLSQLVDLGFIVDTTCICVPNAGKKSITAWLATTDLQYLHSFNVPWTNDKVTQETKNTFENGTGYYSRYYNLEDKNEYLNNLFTLSDFRNIPDERKNYLLALKHVAISAAGTSNAWIQLFSYEGHLLTEGEAEILKRMASVFNQSYVRFLDLQKAEAQTREAQIEAALERVRARSMAMHNSSELRDVVHELRKQMGLLGQKDLDTCVIHLNDESPDFINAFAAIRPPGSTDEIFETTARVPKKGLRLIEEALENYYQKKKDYVIVNEGEKIRQWFEFIEKESPEAFSRILESTRGIDAENLKAFWTFADFPGGSLLMVTSDQPNSSTTDLLRRFANVFGMAYRRFADLKQAEAQAREAQIEASLERVRSKTMAMQKSQDLKVVVMTLYAQLQGLGFQWGAAAIVIMDHVTGDMNWWMEGFSDGYELPESYHVPYFDHPGHLEQLEHWKQGKSYAVISVGGAEKKTYDQYYFYKTEFVKAPELTKQLMMQQEQVLFSMAYMQYGALCWSPTPIAEDQSLILQRFAKVFEQSYTRFLDLQKAELQAREAQIETSLERLRSKTMAMNNSNDVGDTVATMFTEFENLGIHTNRCGILVFEDENYPEVWTARSDASGKSNLIIGKLNLAMHQLIRFAHQAWKNHIPVHRYDMLGEDLINYYDAINQLDLYPVKFDLKTLAKEEFHYDFSFPEGVVFAFCPAPLNDEQTRIMKRFAGVFGQTYRRYLDLQKAEAAAREAVKQAALDRIRAEIASMRTKQDLDRITPLIWNELNILKIPFIRCGIFIMDDDMQQIHTFLSTPDGKAIASFNLPYDTPGNIPEVIEHWRRNKTYAEHWSLPEFASLADSLVQQGEIATREQYMQTIPAEGMYLHFVPFMQGMLYAGNREKLNANDLSLLQSVADAFSTAYARYEDFNKVEKTLLDLRETQKQLIQAEKMASLGELTAGIAHEIQNPLNFVNNFSDVNSELISELKEMINSGNPDDIHELLDMIAENQVKIHHHGQRADGIVKGMLQHSRTSGNAKELTDINALTDEFLRLAFHGLRAQDKSFQSDYEFIPDPSLGKISVVSQEIGRVLLNLVNNAFYAVHVKAKSGITDYKPRVEVVTRRSGNQTIITVTDNGNGIPENIREKIFQPFFTTKPTGQGTGLGLSLSYDIIKAHGGEISFDTVEGEGSTFTVTL